MSKFIIISAMLLLNGFSSAIHASLINVASIKFTTSSMMLTDRLSLSEIILTEKGTGADLALASAGATVFSSVLPSRNSDPAYVIDGLTNNKLAYTFPRNSQTDLPTLTINLAKLSDINSFDVFGKLGKVNKSYLSVDFLDINGNSIYRVANLATTLGRGGQGGLILPNISGQASVVPLPPSVWLFGSGILGLVGVARRKVQA